MGIAVRKFVRVPVLVLITALVWSGSVSAGVTERVSVSSGGQQGNGYSGYNYGVSISADGRYVAFDSAASNLVTGDTAWCYDVFVRDRVTGTTERVSISSAGDEGNGGSAYPKISADGRYVAFQSGADNLVPGDTNGYIDVLVRDRIAGTTERVSLSSTGGEANNDCGDISISADGRYVAFSSTASSLVSNDTNSTGDVFVRDRVTGTTERISVSSTGVQGSGNSAAPSISADGRYVAFQSWAGNLVPGDTNWYIDILVRDRIAGTTERVSLSSSGAQGNDQSYAPSISPDGRYVAFESLASSLVDGDTNGRKDVFVRDRITGTIERVSVSSSGAQGDGTSAIASISADGRYVAFCSSANSLTPGDHYYYDVFVRDRLAGTTERVSVSSTRTYGAGDSRSCSLSADGRYVAFESLANNLVSGDTGYCDVFVRDRWLLAEAKKMADGASVAASAYAVTAVFPGFFYIQEMDRSSGIKVLWPGTLTAGKRVRVDGTMTGASDERAIAATGVIALDDCTLKPFAVSPFSLGGGDFHCSYGPPEMGQKGVLGALGLNNIGLLVRTWGRITSVDSSETPTWFKIDDGSGRQIKCIAEGGNPVIDPAWLGHYATVTGISSCEFDSTNLVSRIRLKKDIVPGIY